MEILTKAIAREENFERVLSAIDAGRCPALLSGTGALPRAHAAAAIYEITGRPVVAICADEGEAGRLASDAAGFTGKEIDRLFGRDFVFYNAEGVSRDGERRRLAQLHKFLSGKAGFTVTTPDALMLRTMPPDVLESLTVELKTGASFDLTELASTLVRAGYERTAQVEGSGQFAIRGGILDVFSPAYEYPVRCEFFGDEIDSMGYFDVGSQRRVEVIESGLILPSREISVSAAKGGAEALARRMDDYGKRLLRKKSVKKELLENVLGDLNRVKEGRPLPASDRYLDLIYEPATAVDYLPEDAVIIMCEPGRLADRAKNFIWQLNQDMTALKESGVIDGDAGRLTEDWDSLTERLGEFPVIMMASFTTSAYPLPPKTISSMTAKQLPSYGGSLETASSDISHYMRSGYRVVVLVRDKRRGEILKEYLEKHDIACSFDFELRQLPPKGTCVIAEGALSAGLEYPDIQLAVITEGQIIQNLFRGRRKKKLPSNRQKLDSFTDLSPGDLVVHEHYGIGRFVGMVKRRVDNVEKDYIKIAYSGTDSLYIPATQLDMVSKYIGAGEDAPVRLSKLGGTDWSRAKSKAKAAVKELADGLIKLQAERRKATGHAFSPDTPWQQEFEDAFEYQETDDQLRAIRDIKADMECPVPMDRLLCGDVGYGKTEVALRAVMKCVMDGKQAAILVPTTVLAQQHYQTAARRFSGFPVNIEVLSRFRSPAQTKKAVSGLASGEVDIIIGTHKLLQKDIKFKRLGLLVVDEEQRFGVQHKERLKEIARQVDVLTLSATPIPRTLNMALSGVRDMSTIEEPPSDRQPVQTYVMEHDWGVIADAIRREISRGGQVYYLHNRVDNIERTAVHIRDMIEGVTVAVAHGKMDEESLNSVMESMQAGDIQVLVCTTIIETGIDIPNVNTLIIEDADRMGLAQLHQIRGRVGRSSRRAFAYFTFRREKVLSEIAEKRLSAIREFAEFNSGFKIAMRDLEIRGAGNILGAEQSGHMMSVGYDMYLKLLEEAVHEEKGEKVAEKPECSADLAVSANIPESYVQSAEQRMDLYRRIAHIRTEEDADDMTDELIDRFGDPPSQVNALIHIALLRGEAADTGISEISQKQGRLIFGLSDFEMERVSRLYSLPKYKDRIKIEAGTKPAISLKLRTGDRVLETAVTFVRDYKSS
ncbi:MAG: transcription-repair coupling factor [Oscillospiraceae bacterium]